MTKPSKPTNCESARKNLLYVGTTEKQAKEAPLKGIEPPVVLSDVYPGYFAFWALTGNDQRWGIVEVDVENLMPDSIAPFHGYLERLGRKGKYTTEEILKRREEYLEKASSCKEQWKKSLDACGVVLYLLKIPPHAITKVTIYTPFGKGGNAFITEASVKYNPWEILPPAHKSAYGHNLALTKWLTCEAVSAEDLWNDQMNVDEILQNRLGLDLFYRRTEKDLHSWWKI